MIVNDVPIDPTDNDPMDVSDERTDHDRLLTSAFPYSQRSKALTLAAIVPVDRYNANATPFRVSLRGELLHIPQRIAAPETLLETQRSDGDLMAMLRCLYSRHHNGYVRERALREMILSRQAFVIPYIVQLASEYVEPILCLIRDHLPLLDGQAYASFLQENTGYTRIVRSRIVSYWNEYYRGRFPHRSGYAGFDILQFFDAALREKRSDT